MTAVARVRARWAKLPALSRFLGSVYFAWSCFIYFATLWTKAHAWWPIFLYFLIYPLGWLYHEVADRLFRAIYPQPLGAEYELYDRISAFFYIVGGTTWMVGLGLVFTAVADWAFQSPARPGTPPRPH